MVLTVVLIKVLSSGIQSLVVRSKSTDVSEEHIAYIFRTYFATCFHADILLSLFFHPKIEAVCSPETSVDFSGLQCIIHHLLK
jgi:hypothetical protein